MADIARNILAPLGMAALLIPLTVVDARAPAPIAPAAAPATICGWVANPTPANWWITDRFGQWVMMTQGSEGVDGMDTIPDLTEKQWVKTNGYYGYGCGCMRATVNKAKMQIIRIHSFTQKSLKTCRADRKLAEPRD
ncbi:MAG: DUF4087 domain-containing protein [Pseudomonadota bacterium]